MTRHDRARRRSTFRRPADARKVKNNLATVLVYGSLRGSRSSRWSGCSGRCVSKGLHAITRNGWFTQSQRGITYRDPGGGA